MCRLTAYLGPETSLEHIIFDTKHSLEKQSWQPRELREAKLNADGFGLGWFNDNGEIARYRQTLPIWADPNLRSITQSLHRPLWLCYIRSATPGLGTSLENTQPFCAQNWQYFHNGYINNFHQDIRARIRHLLPHEMESIIQGSTDSEYLFALILHNFQQSNDMIKAIHDSFKQLEEWLGNERALLNVMLSDGIQVIASCHALNGECPSLYYGKDIDEFPPHSQLIVSEKLNDDSHWKAIAAHQIIRLRPDVAAEYINI